MTAHGRLGRRPGQRRPETRGYLMTIRKIACLTTVTCLGFAAAGAAWADDAPAAGPMPMPLSTPAMSSSLSSNGAPYSVDSGPLGKIYFGGQATAMGFWTSNPVPGNSDKGKLDASNAQIEIQKTDGVFQFYVQAGVYNFPSLGAGYVSTGRLTDETYKSVPVAFIKLVPNAEWNIMIGKLPTLIGAEYTFTFENLNIERGLLWNQETAVSRGVQVNYAKGPLTVSASWNDGFYSNHYNTGSALVSYVISPKDTVAFVASGAFSNVSTSRFVTPVAQNNGTIWNAIWTHTEGAWVINPYLQYTTTPKDAALGLPRSASTIAGAILAKSTTSPTPNLPRRAQYTSSPASQTPPL